jgi:hypothetical protein
LGTLERQNGSRESGVSNNPPEQQVENETFIMSDLSNEQTSSDSARDLRTNEPGKKFGDVV